MKRILLTTTVLTGVLFTACKKDERIGTLNGGTVQTQLSYSLVAGNAATGTNQKTTAGTFVWTAGYAYPKIVKFEAEKDNMEIEYKSTNNERIDLFAPTPINFGGFTIPNGVYDEIELKIELDGHGNDPALYLEGQYSSATLTVPIRVEVQDKLELKTEHENVEITDGMAFTAITTIDLAAMVPDISESMLLNAKLTNGVLVVSKNSNRNIYYKVFDNLLKHKYRCHFNKKK